MVCQQDPLVQKIIDLYVKISNLETLNPSKDVDTLFTELVLTCIPPTPIDVTKLCQKIQEIRSNLIKLCGTAEGLLEKHYSTILGSFQTPLENLHIFPYFNNYIKLSLLEHNILAQKCTQAPTTIAFVGSGPLPLTSIVLASNHLKNTIFHNYDIDHVANSMASKLIESDSDLSKRMFFHTVDILDVTIELKKYDVVFLAALVGMEKKDKIGVIEHLAKNMNPGAFLMMRSAHGARAFLYPVIEEEDLQGLFEVLTIFHPTDDVINSVVLARKFEKKCNLHEDYDHLGMIGNGKNIVLPIKCCCAEMQAFSPFGQMNLIEEFASFEEHRI
ncbi:hypothetical protein LIER_23054 [Lithospermum erythrorhizon]|uniref:Nicotianamine synthase n=1 Tax=Lithospermum erythrorhizon TaxID=34254 RepID=A0AAV3QZ73_LITER